MDEFIDKLLYMQKRYVDIKRSSLVDEVPESLNCHVGQLPFVATMIYDYIEPERVDIHRVLLMLAVHDLGELEYGDYHFSKKSTFVKKREFESAKKYVPDMFWLAYEEYYYEKSISSKFAHAIDAISANIRDLALPTNARIQLWTKYNISKEKLLQHKLRYFLFDHNMTKLYYRILNRLVS